MGVPVHGGGLRGPFATPVVQTARIGKLQRPRERTANRPRYNRAFGCRGSMRILTGAAMQGLAEPVGRIDRPAVFQGEATRLWLSVKGLFRLPLRQAVGMVRALLKAAGLDGPLPDGTALCRRPKTPTVRMPCLCVGGPLNLPADRTGIRFPGDGEWHAPSSGAERCPPHARREALLRCGEGDCPWVAGRETATCVSPGPERRSHKRRLHPHNGRPAPAAGGAGAGRGFWPPAGQGPV
ncbi:MAG: transposase [Rhodobacter sp.]|nr:transposase [Rhodobacter sp.]MCA3535273.1 transposase [Rhodobacter sp.]MCA3537976.1 transposase [Rhodobacter sp.]MCA3541265.1 transposase [Rhodobacter sp.]MCA3551041.1 transposase [Rhodobacter sp.]